MAERSVWQSWGATLALAIGLTLIFWLPIWCGAGFVGGDVYSYFFPQKVVYAEALKSGELPLWNPRAGFGYPLLAESQTGVFYPINLLLYRVLEVHTAYHVSFLLHYVLAFVFATLAARRMGISQGSAWLTALIYVYGWFPPRTCVEWAIIGGTWLPLSLWCVESFLATRLWRHAIGLSFVLCVQLLAGHFQIAWFTLLLLATYVPARLWWFRDAKKSLRSEISKPKSQISNLKSQISKPKSQSPNLKSQISKPKSEISNLKSQISNLNSVVPDNRRADGRPPPDDLPSAQPVRGLTPTGSPDWQMAAVAYCALLCGLGLAAVQLLPTYELKQRSQRATVGRDHELDFGAIPPYYWSQLVWPSHWYSPITNREEFFSKHPPLGHARTNSTEAHLYYGLASDTLLAVWMSWFITRLGRSRPTQREFYSAIRQLGQAGFWCLIQGASLLYTTGWLLPITRYLPGFSFFQGPGRYGLLTSWSTAMLVGLIVDGQAFANRVGSSPPLPETREPPRWLAVAMLVGVAWALVSAWFLAEDSDFVAAEAGMPHPLVVIGSIVLTAGPVLALAIAGILAAVVGAWLVWRSGVVTSGWRLLFVVLFVATTLEFWLVSRLVTFTQMVDSPPLTLLEQSPVRRMLLDAVKTRPTLRLFAPGANLPTTLGVSSAPIYLTFGPAEYVDDKRMLPPAPEGVKTAPATHAQLDWMRRSGVTHVLCFEPPPNDFASLKLVWQGDDPFLNRAWGRSRQPLFLYEIEDAPGRLQWRRADGSSRKNSDILPESQAEHDTSWGAKYTGLVTCLTQSDEAGLLMLADLDYPGWNVEIDDQPAAIQRVDGIFRGVAVPAGGHVVTWKYRPRSVFFGAVISVATLLLLAAVAHVRFWHPRRFSDQVPKL